MKINKVTLWASLGASLMSPTFDGVTVSKNTSHTPSTAYLTPHQVKVRNKNRIKNKLAKKARRR